MGFKATEYQLTSVLSGGRRPDDGGWTLAFGDDPQPSLIRAVYENKQLAVRNDLPGLYRFADWLPIGRILEGSGAPITYKSEALADELGMSDLWVTFNGWWPEKGAAMKTGTFKECEAYSVGGRMGDDFDRILVVASAGNTARAFAKVCSDNKIPLLLFVPQDNLNALWFDGPLESCVKLMSPESGGDYFDAIRMSGAAVGRDAFVPEGGAKNIARRDGMATTVLSAVTTIGKIPDAYFQAVGSGTGAIAAWEANLRFLEDGRFGDNLMRLIVSQNAPFIPMVDTWNAKSREFLIADDDAARSQVNQVNAKVLTNRRPPWGLAGGLFDALEATGGDVLSATNDEARIAGQRFLQLEGIDVSPAASVAVASLFGALRAGKVLPDETVMLNITGGGMERFKADHDITMLEPDVVLPLDAPEERIGDLAEELFA